jgi:hypothetical protein
VHGILEHADGASRQFLSALHEIVSPASTDEPAQLELRLQRGTIREAETPAATEADGDGWVSLGNSGLISVQFRYLGPDPDISPIERPRNLFADEPTGRDPRPENLPVPTMPPARWARSVDQFWARTDASERSEAPARRQHLFCTLADRWWDDESLLPG